MFNGVVLELEGGALPLLVTFSFVGLFSDRSLLPEQLHICLAEEKMRIKGLVVLRGRGRASISASGSPTADC